MKVIHVITSPCGGGAEFIVRELAHGINGQGLESKVVYFNIDPGCAKKMVLASNEFLLNIGYRDVRAILLLREFFKNEMEANGCVVVHAHLTWPMIFVPLSLIGLNVVAYFTEHATSNRRRSYPFLRFIERFFYRRYKNIFCVSDGVRQTLEPWVGRALSSRLKVIKNGARLFSVKNRNVPNIKISFISVGSLRVSKGFDRVIRALSRFDLMEWDYTIVGEGSDRGELEALIYSLGLQKKVNLIGWSGDLEPWFHNADIQLVPSRFEGFGLVAVEGMSTGLPVIASDVVGLSEVVSGSQSAAYLVSDPDNDEEWLVRIKECIMALTKDIHEVSCQARETAERFSLDEMIANYTDIYKDCERTSNSRT